MKKIILLLLAGITTMLCRSGQAEAGHDAALQWQAARLSEHAMAQYSRGRLEEAKADFEAARVSLAKLVGPCAPVTLDVRNNYAAVLFAMGDLAGAEVEHRRTMALRDRTLGRLHMEAIASRHNLALTLMFEGKYEEALTKERCVESARRHLLGRNDPKSRQARRLRMLIEDAMKNGKPSSVPSGLGTSPVLKA